MRLIRQTVASDPRRALDLITAADHAHPDSPLAEERASLRVDALVNIGQIGQARDAAEAYYDRYPHGSFAAHLEQLTGAHPHSTP